MSTIEAVAASEQGSPPLLSVVIPFYNEEACVDHVCGELFQALAEEAAHIPTWEAILVDDGSRDGTERLIDAWSRRTPFRALHIRPNSGQSAALAAGFNAAQGTFIGTMDGDGQNDPRDLSLLLNELQRRNIDMMCGIRQHRADGFVRKVSSRIANGVRRAVLHDGISDVGCSMRVFRRDCLTGVTFFRNAHRFFPALVMAAGYQVVETPVRHRRRHMGTSKYGAGINSRLWVGLADLAGVAWLTRRTLRYQVSENLEQE